MGLNILGKNSMIYIPIKHYEGLYEISSTGTVRSLNRVITDKNGVNYLKKGKFIKQIPHKDLKYMTVSLWKNNKGTTLYTHRLVASAFLQNQNNLPEVNHIDGVRTNNDVSNLEWCTRKENAIHAVKTGLKTYTNRLSKGEFTECLFAVLNGESYYSISQRTPYKVPFLSVKLRRLAKELDIEGELNESLKIQKIERARINGNKNRQIT